MEVPRRPGYSLTVDKIAKSSLARDPTREIVYRVTAGGDRIERYDYSKAFEKGERSRQRSISSRC